MLTTPRDEAEFRRWLASLQSDYQLQLVRQERVSDLVLGEGKADRRGPGGGLRVCAPGPAACRRADGQHRPP